MSKINDGGPAFPRPSGPEPRVDSYHECFEGMSLRAWLAGIAMQGILQSCEPMKYGVTGEESESVAESALMCADALIAELEKDKP